MNFIIKQLFSYPLALCIMRTYLRHVSVNYCQVIPWYQTSPKFQRQYGFTSDNIDLFFCSQLQVYYRLTCNTSIHYCNAASRCCFLCDQRKERKNNDKILFKFLSGKVINHLSLLWIGHSCAAEPEIVVVENIFLSYRESLEREFIRKGSK